jgi:ribonuclease T2
LADGYKFAVSWQPAFCETHRQKPECGVVSPQLYQATHFTLHGLWPNKNSCGTHYGFCGKYGREQRPFCNYAPLSVDKTFLEQLGKYMPSARYGSCLQRHEWYKHGTCQTTWDTQEYFATAIRLVEEFNEAGMSSFMKSRIGTFVTVNEFFSAVDQAFGQDAHRRMKVGCKNGNLVDIYMNLPAVIPADASLADLIQQAAEAFGNNCGDRFKVDKIGY